LVLAPESAGERPTTGANRSVLTALRTLEQLAKGPAGVSELSRVMGIPKTTTQRALVTLADAGWVRPGEGDRTSWMLTGRCLSVGLAGSVEGNLREIARVEMERLRDATGETVHLLIPDVPDIVVVARVDGNQSLRTFLPLGTHAPLYATASGRALLSVMTDDEVAKVLDAGLQTFTGHTLAGRGEVLAEVLRARTRGYALNSAEWRDDIAAVGSAIVSRTGTPVAALSISMPLSRYDETDLSALGRMISAAAGHVGEQLHDWQHSDT
jgi:IclR family acetate operon transcriptional repressor